MIRKFYEADCLNDRGGESPKVEGAKEGEPTIIDYLLGQSHFEGVWYGERHPESKGLYWWRNHLKVFIELKNQRIAELEKENERLRGLVD